MLRLRSQRNSANPSARSCIATKETWLLSMACRLKPVSLQSKLASVTRSFTASTTFFSRLPCTRRASNIAMVFDRRLGSDVRVLRNVCKPMINLVKHRVK